MQFEALEVLGEKLSVGSSSSSGSAGTPCFSYDEFFHSIAEVIAALDTDKDPVLPENTSPVISTLGSPTNQLFTSWSAQALNNFTNGTGWEGYTAWQNGIIGMVLRDLHRIPPDLLSCYCSDVENLILASPASAAEKRTALIGMAAAKGAVFHWTERAEDPDEWAPYLDADFGVRWARIPYQVSTAFHGALSVFSGSLEGTPSLCAPADIISAIVGSTTVTAASIILKATPGVRPQ